MIALGEWHWAQEDSDLRIRLVRHPQFSEKVRYVVTECANSLYQATLDRYIRGEAVPQLEFQKLFREVTTPGGCDSPVYEQFLREIQKVNRDLPSHHKIRVLAGEYPIDWGKVKDRQDWNSMTSARDSFAANLIASEILRKKKKALIIYGAGHVYRNMIPLAPRNLVSLLDREFPGRVYVVIRLHGVYPETAKLEQMIQNTKRPILLSLTGTALGILNANQFISRDLPSRWFPEGQGMGRVADACVYSGQTTDTTMNPDRAILDDPEYSAEKARRMRLITGGI